MQHVTCGVEIGNVEQKHAVTFDFIIKSCTRTTMNYEANNETHCHIGSEVHARLEEIRINSLVIVLKFGESEEGWSLPCTHAHHLSYIVNIFLYVY